MNNLLTEIIKYTIKYACRIIYTYIYIQEFIYSIWIKYDNNDTI